MPGKEIHRVVPWEVLLAYMGALQAVLQETEPQLADLRLEPKGLFLLLVLDDNPHPADLARALLLPRPTVTFLVKRAEAAGYVRREGVPRDLRRYRLTLTPEGRRAMEQGRTALDRTFGARLERLRPEEVRSLAAMLRTLLGTGATAGLLGSAQGAGDEGNVPRGRRRAASTRE